MAATRPIRAWDFLADALPKIYPVTDRHRTHESSSNNSHFDPIRSALLESMEEEFTVWLSSQVTSLGAIEMNLPSYGRQSMAFSEADTSNFFLRYCLEPVSYIHDAAYHVPLTASMYIDTQQKFLGVKNASLHAVPDWVRLQVVLDPFIIYPRFIVEVKYTGALSVSPGFFVSTAWKRMSRQIRKYFETGADFIALTDYENIILLQQCGTGFKFLQGGRTVVKQIVLFGMWLASNKREQSLRTSTSEFSDIAVLRDHIRQLCVADSERAAPAPEKRSGKNQANLQASTRLRGAKIEAGHLLILKSTRRPTFDRTLSPGTFWGSGKIKSLIHENTFSEEVVAGIPPSDKLSSSVFSDSTTSRGPTSSVQSAVSSFTSDYPSEGRKQADNPRKHASSLVEALHQSPKAAVVVEQVLASSSETQVLRCTLVSDKLVDTSSRPSTPPNPPFILKVQNEDAMTRESQAYTRLQAEQGCLIPYYYGEFELDGTDLKCIALEMVEGRTLDRFEELSHVESAKNFIKKHRHCWLTLLAYGMRHGDLEPRNVIMTPRGPCLVDFNHAGPVMDPLSDCWTLETALFCNTIEGADAYTAEIEKEMSDMTGMVWRAVRKFVEY